MYAKRADLRARKDASVIYPFPLEDSMDEQRKYATLFAATILAARKLNEIGSSRVQRGSAPIF